MIVASDTTAISSLYRIGKLDLLQLLFHEITLPTAVFEELTALETFGYDITAIKNAVCNLRKKPTLSNKNC